MVMKAALKGMSESITQFTPMIMEHCDKINGGSRKGGVPGDALTAKMETANVTNTTSPIPVNGAANKQSELNNKTANGWYDQMTEIWETIQDILPIPIGVILTGLLVLYMLWAWTRTAPNQHDGICQPSMNHQVISRAIYLRDVEEGLLNTTHHVSYMDPHW